MSTRSQRMNNSHQCNIFNKSKNIKFKTSDAYLFAYTNLLADRENRICRISRCTRSSQFLFASLNVAFTREYNHTHACICIYDQILTIRLNPTDTCPHSLTVGHCINKKKETYIKAALK